MLYCSLLSPTFNFHLSFKANCCVKLWYFLLCTFIKIAGLKNYVPTKSEWGLFLNCAPFFLKYIQVQWCMMLVKICILLLSKRVTFLKLQLPSIKDQSAAGFYPTGDKTAQTLKSRLIFFQLTLHCVPVPAGGYFKLAWNGAAHSGGLTWSCHSQCLRPLSQRCQALEGCHGYPQNVCRPPWWT